jgi:hypothetical protein
LPTVQPLAIGVVLLAGPLQLVLENQHWIVGDVQVAGVVHPHGEQYPDELGLLKRSTVGLSQGAEAGVPCGTTSTATTCQSPGHAALKSQSASSQSTSPSSSWSTLSSQIVSVAAPPVPSPPVAPAPPGPDAPAPVAPSPPPPAPSPGGANASTKHADNSKKAAETARSIDSLYSIAAPVGYSGSVVRALRRPCLVSKRRRFGRSM